MENSVRKREWVKTAAIIFLAVLLVLTFFSKTIMNASLPEVAAQQAASGAINARIRAFNIALEQAKLPGILELLPTYRSVMIQYDPMVIGTEALKAKLSAIAKNLDSIAIPPASVVELPVLYGGEMGPDLAFVAEHARITPDEVIQLHTEPEYLIYMLGFTPGFTYLGGLNYFTDSDPQAKLTYADLKEHIGVDCSEYQYQEEYQRGVYTWYAAEDEACCLSLFFGDNGKLMAAGAYNLSL